MIIASLHGKLPELMNRKDALTSTVFGRIRYLHHAHVLVPYLQSAYSYNAALSLGEYLSQQKVDLALYSKVSYKFWAKHPTYGEPDLILLFQDHQQGEPDLLIVIEVKLYSSKSGTGENDQLMRYYIAVNNSISGFSDSDLSQFKGRIGPLIYLTEYEAQTEIIESSNAIHHSGRVQKDPIFHLRWQRLYHVLEQYNKQ